MKAMILSSGKGERMLPLTKDIPKAMLKVGNVTLLEDKIIKLAEAGIKDIIINTGYLGEYIKDHVGNGSKFGINIIISDEGELPIGTANGIRKVLDIFKNEPFIIINADIWSNYLLIDLKNKLHNSESLAHLVLVPKPNYLDGDFNLNTDKKIVKGTSYVYTGIGVYQPKLFNKYSDEDLGVILHKEENIKVEIYEGLWHDIGTPGRLDMIRKSIGL